MTLGEKIYTFRTARGMSQADLAEALDVSRQSISKWETDASVPELDKLIKLSEIFGVSLDELILRKERTTAQAEPQQIPCVPTVGLPRKISGLILLCFGAVIWLLITLLGDLISGLLFSLPFVLCGLVLLCKRRFPGLWCGWAIYLCIDTYLRYATGISASDAFVPVVYAYSTPIHLLVAWGLVAAFAGLTATTCFQYRKAPLKNTNRNLFYVIGLWLLFALSHFLILPFHKIVVVPDMTIYIRFAYAGVGWIKRCLLVASLVQTLRFAYSVKTK